MSRAETFVIVGGAWPPARPQFLRGLAAGKAAEELREHGHDGPVLLVGDERERPYIRPPLSKGYLLGKEERESIHVHPAAARTAGAEVTVLKHSELPLLKILRGRNGRLGPARSRHPSGEPRGLKANAVTIPPADRSVR